MKISSQIMSGYTIKHFYANVEKVRRGGYRKRIPRVYFCDEYTDLDKHVDAMKVLAQRYPHDIMESTEAKRFILEHVGDFTCIFGLVQTIKACVFVPSELGFYSFLTSCRPVIHSWTVQEQEKFACLYAREFLGLTELTVEMLNFPLDTFSYHVLDVLKTRLFLNQYFREMLQRVDYPDEVLRFLAPHVTCVDFGDVFSGVLQKTRPYVLWEFAKRRVPHRHPRVWCRNNYYRLRYMYYCVWPVLMSHLDHKSVLNVLPIELHRMIVRLFLY